jgi:hypothetical protein
VTTLQPASPVLPLRPLAHRAAAAQARRFGGGPERADEAAAVADLVLCRLAGRLVAHPNPEALASLAVRRAVVRALRAADRGGVRFLPASARVVPLSALAGDAPAGDLLLRPALSLPRPAPGPTTYDRPWRPVPPPEPFWVRAGLPMVFCGCCGLRRPARPGRLACVSCENSAWYAARRGRPVGGSSRD